MKGDVKLGPRKTVMDNNRRLKTKGLFNFIVAFCNYKQALNSDVDYNQIATDRE